MKNQLDTNQLLSQDKLQSVTGYSFDKMMQNPDRVIRKKGVSQEWDFYQEVEADDMVTTCINKIIRGASSLKWEIYKSDSDDKVFEMVNNNFTQLNHSGFIRDIIKSMVKTIAYGRQFIEVNWEYIDGYWQVSKLETLPLELFKYNIDGTIKIVDKTALRYEDLPELRLLNPRNNASLRNMYGESLLSKSYWNVFFKKNALQFMNVFLERDGMPWILGEYDEQILATLFPSDTPESAVSKLMDIVKTKSMDAILLLPKGVDIRTDNPASSSNATNYKLLIDICNESISRIWTGHTATTIATPGKLGNDRKVSDDFTNVIDDAKEIVIETMNQLISWMVQVNFSEQTMSPLFQFYKEETINKDLAVRDGLLAQQLGVMFSKEYISREHSIPEDEFEIVPPVQGGQTDPLAQKLTPVVNKIKNGLIAEYSDVADEINLILGSSSLFNMDVLVNKCLELALR